MTKHHHSAHTVCPCAMQPLTNDLVFMSMCVCASVYVNAGTSEREKVREEWREGQKETAVSIPLLIFK